MSKKKPYYFHSDHIRAFIMSAGLLVLTILGISDTHSFVYKDVFMAIVCWFLSIILLVACIALLLGMWKFRHTKELPKMKPGELVIEFKDDLILFPEGYHFTQSAVHIAKQISAAEITEVNLRTSPASVVLHDKEVIFLKYDIKEELNAFAERNGLRLADRYDIWGAINEPFVDTELDYGMRKNILENLKESGITVKELRAIRKKIAFTMLSSNYFAMEWIYLGQFDYLRWTMRNEKKYWWSMDIALRNYKKA
jgi:hypothetical protein